MDERVIAAKEPAVLSLEPGTYYWCRCGRSESQPFCDGGHHGTSFSPMELVLTRSNKVALCQCKHTQTPPFCDGTHRTLYPGVAMTEEGAQNGAIDQTHKKT